MRNVDISCNKCLTYNYSYAQGPVSSVGSFKDCQFEGEWFEPHVKRQILFISTDTSYATMSGYGVFTQ